MAFGFKPKWFDNCEKKKITFIRTAHAIHDTHKIDDIKRWITCFDDGFGRSSVLGHTLVFAGIDERRLLVNQRTNLVKITDNILLLLLTVSRVGGSNCNPVYSLTAKTFDSTPAAGEGDEIVDFVMLNMLSGRCCRFRRSDLAK